MAPKKKVKEIEEIIVLPEEIPPIIKELQDKTSIAEPEHEFIIQKEEIPVKDLPPPQAKETIIIRENGEIRLGTRDDMKGKNEWYVIHSKQDGLILIDYDQTKIRPYIKDILNRQNMFIEIKLLRFVLYALGLLFFMIFWILWFVMMKATTVTDLEKLQKTISTSAQKQIIPPYVPPVETTPIIRKNIPSNVPTN